jgi:hypothetical protein
LFGEGLHAKRVQSLTNATVGVMTSASLAVSTIGHGLALAPGGISKHAIKQDRLLSNPGIDVKELPVNRLAKLTPRIAASWNVTESPSRLAMRDELIRAVSRLSRPESMRGLWAGRAIGSPSRPQTRPRR